MTHPDRFLDSPDGTREEIMRATYLALCTHGYADLTIQRIGEEFAKSKSLIYHHYEGKDDLLLDFLEFTLERFEDTMPLEAADGADDHLEAVFDHVFATPLPDARREFIQAMVELRAQAAHDDRYREQFTRHDHFFRDRLAAIIDRGIEEGHFTAVDAHAVATFLLSVFNGSMVQRTTSEDDPATTIRDQLERYTRAVLIDDR